MTKEDNSNKDEKEKVKKLLLEVDKAEAQLVQSFLGTAQLHILWRKHLFRMSLLVLAVAFHQCRTPTMECMKNIKNALSDESNNITPQEISISGMQSTFLILQDSAPEIMGIVMVVCLATFLSSNDNIKLSSLPYMISAMFVPLQLALFFQKPTIGCIDVLQASDSVAALPRHFPVSVVYHAVATMCCMLMEHQISVRKNDIRDIKNLRVTINKKTQEQRKQK